MNFVIKCLYVTVNLIALFVLNNSLDNYFINYGTEWARWKLTTNATVQMAFEDRTSPTPGNRMLPSFGLCDMTDSRIDVTKVYTNKMKVICELSTHVLYQYVFLLLWFVLVLSLTLSCVGVLLYIGGHLKNICLCRKNSPKRVYKILTVRECEYLEFIRRRDLSTYGAILNKLNNRNSPYSNGNHDTHNHVNSNHSNHNHNHFESQNDDLENMKLVAVSEA